MIIGIIIIFIITILLPPLRAFWQACDLGGPVIRNVTGLMTRNEILVSKLRTR